QMRRGGDKLRVAVNGASIGAPDQKLSRPEAANEQCEGREEWLSLPFIATNEWQFRNFTVRFVLDRTLNLGVRFRVLNIFVIIPMFSFSLCVIPDGAKSVPAIKLTARVSAQLGPTAYPISIGKIH
ncbi:hypothetical protein PIB30_065372, partial [Stylosanthes scabra]|nr:hypothetical protein [Stylosanthes scabra]